MVIVLNALEKKHMTVIDKTVKAEDLGNIFKTVGKTSIKATNKITTIFKKNPGRALEIRAKVGSAVVSKCLKAASSTLLDFMNFYQTGKELSVSKLV